MGVCACVGERETGGVTVIGVTSEIGNSSSNPGQSCLHFAWKGMNKSFFPQLLLSSRVG